MQWDYKQKGHESQYHCVKCMKGGDPIRIVMPQQLLLGDGQKLESAEKFCYLGDVIGAGGGAEEAARARVRSAWAKFRELAIVMTSRRAYLKVQGKVLQHLCAEGYGIR